MKKFAVIGNPISHSKSPQIHAMFAEQFGHSIEYKTELSPLDGFQQTIFGLIVQQFTGVNVTLPFKEQAFAIADEVSERAEIAGASNTLSFREGKIYADNTDGQGLVEDLIRLCGSLKSKRILVIGAGGAAKGCMLPLIEAKVRSIGIFNRTEVKAELLARQFAVYGETFSCSGNQLCDHQFDVIINSTSSSVTGEVPSIDGTIFRKAEIAYDMFYGDNLTAFMLFAEENSKNIHTSDGFGMLVGQAAESYRVWHDVRPDIERVIRSLRK